MNKTCLPLLMVSLFLSPIFGEEILVKHAVKVFPTRQASNKSSIGIVPGSRSCGGPGRFVQWRYETCRKEDVPCRVPADSSINRAEVDFIPSRNIPALGLRLKVKSRDGKVKREYNYPGPIEFAVALRAGHTYTIANAGGVSENLRGKLATFQYILFDKKTNEVEVCAEAEFLYT